MVDYSNVSLKPPKNWQDFERHSRILFECILNDRTVQNNGRAGQPQHGVDIFGRKDAKGTQWIGVQCKGKDTEYGWQVTEGELKKEVGNARNFIPALSEFILITTASTDAKIQEIARILTQENEEAGNPFNVSVWGWGELESRILEHPRAIQTFHPDLTPFTDAITEGIGRIEAQAPKIDFLVEAVKQIQAQSVDGMSASSEVIDKNLHAEIDGYRDLLKKGKSQTAIDLLTALKDRIWSTATPRIKFRIITNIGAGYHIKGDQPAAAKHFHEAIKYQPDDKIAFANVSLAYLLEGDKTAAIAAAYAALDKDKTNGDAASYIIQAHKDDLSIADPYALIPSECYDLAPVKVALIFFFRDRGDDAWIDIAKTAFHTFPEVEQIERAAAEADLHSVLGARGFLVGQQSQYQINLDALNKAISVLQILWDKQKDADVPYGDGTMAHNLAQAYRAIENKTAARTIADEALRLTPDATFLLKLRAVLHLEDGKYTEALQLLEKIQEDDLEVKLLIAELKLEGTPNECRLILEQVIKPENPLHFRIFAAQLVAASYLKESKPEKAFEAINVLAKANPQEVHLITVLGGIQRVIGDTKSANETLTKAKSLLTDTSHFFDRFSLAKEFEHLKRYEDAVEILESRVELTHDSPALMMLMASLINCDRRNQAYEIFQNLPAKIKKKPFFLRIAIALYNRRGDLASTEAAVKEYLDQNPNDLETHLNHLTILLRRRNEQAIHTFLSSDVEKLAGDPEDQMRMAQLLDRFGFNKRALDFGYRVRIKNRANASVQLAYVGLLLKPGTSEKVDLERATVEQDTVFSIENGRGRQETFLIESDETLRLLDEAITPDHAFAQKAMGLKVNDAFKINETDSDKDAWTIKTIKHKYIHVLHSSMERFQQQFPSVHGLQSVPIDYNDEKPLDPILSRVKERSDALRVAISQYEQGFIPLQILAEHLGGDVIDIGSCISSNGHKLRVCFGTKEERADAVRAIVENRKNGCVVDALTLYLIHELDIAEAVIAVCGRMGLTESIVDIFRRRREQIIAQEGRSFMTLYWKDGQYFREEVSAEQISQTLKDIDEKLDWIEKNCDIVPAAGTAELPAEIRAASSDLGVSFLDSALAAQGSNRLLLCEDLTYRIFATKTTGIKSSWLQPVLMQAVRIDALTQEQYNQIIYRLVAGGHSFTSTDWQILSYLSIREEDLVRFKTVIRALFGKDAEPNSHLAVVCTFLSSIWADGIPSLHEMVITSTLLEKVVLGDWHARWKEIAALLKSNVISPNNNFANYLSSWLKGHFLEPFNSPDVFDNTPIRSAHKKRKNKKAIEDAI